MRQTFRWTHLLLACLTLIGGAHAQSGQTITIRMLDAKTGHLIATSEFLVQVDHEKEQHAGMVHQNTNGAGEMTAPEGAKLISIHAMYDGGLSVYVNCDTDQDRGSADRDESMHHWYTISEILATGVVAPDGCGTAKQAALVKATARPGEFVFFVRKKKWREDEKDF